MATVEISTKVTANGAVIKIGKRIYRSATPQEKVTHQQVREQIQQELPVLKERARQKLKTVLGLCISLLLRLIQK